MAQARITLSFLAHMLDLPEGTRITHVNTYETADDRFAEIIFDQKGAKLPDSVQLVYADDEFGLPALVSIEAL